MVPIVLVVPMLFLFCTLRDTLCLVLPYSLSVCFFRPFSILITLLGEEGAGLCACYAFVLRVYVFVFFSSSGCRGLAAVCDCGTPWTFLLTFYR